MNDININIVFKKVLAGLIQLNIIKYREVTNKKLY